MKLSDHEIRDLLRKAIKDAGSLSELARQTGISKSHISKVASAIKPPSPAILTILRIRKVETKEVTYERI